MPIPAIVRGTLFFSSLVAASSYALYQSNPQFRAFVDNTLNRITSAWDDFLATLSPEERQRQREAQRRELAIALEGRDAKNDTEDKSQASASASGAAGIADGSRARRRMLWEIAEKNAEKLRQRQQGREQVPSSNGESSRDATALNTSSSNSSKTDVDPVISSLAAAASHDPRLTKLMQDVASGKATSSQLADFQSQVDGLRSLNSSSSTDSKQLPVPPPTDPVIQLLVKDASKDIELQNLMEVVSSGTANDAQLEDFAARIHLLDNSALERNGVDATFQSPPLPSNAKSPSMDTVLFEQDSAEKGNGPFSKDTPVHDPLLHQPIVAPDPEEEDITSDRFQSATMSQLFPELTTTHEDEPKSQTRADSDPPISIPVSEHNIFTEDDDEDEEYSAILTPPSPSLQSVSDIDTEPISHISEAVSDDEDAQSVISEASWVTGVSDMSGWDGLNDPGEVRER